MPCARHIPQPTLESARTTTTFPNQPAPNDHPRQPGPFLKRTNQRVRLQHWWTAGPLSNGPAPRHSGGSLPNMPCARHIPQPTPESARTTTTFPNQPAPNDHPRQPGPFLKRTNPDPRPFRGFTAQYAVRTAHPAGNPRIGLALPRGIRMLAPVVGVRKRASKGASRPPSGRLSDRARGGCRTTGRAGPTRTTGRAGPPGEPDHRATPTNQAEDTQPRFATPGYSGCAAARTSTR